MTLRLLSASLGVVAVLALACVAPAAGAGRNGQVRTAKAEDVQGRRRNRKTEKATFGGGCFWCSEAVFERIPGVKSVVSGFAGGHVPNPTYEDVCTGLTGHAEVVQVEYDPAVVSYEKLLNVFWKSHDPTTLNQPGRRLRHPVPLDHPLQHRGPEAGRRRSRTRTSRPAASSATRSSPTSSP